MAMGHWGTTVLPGRIRTHIKRVDLDWETLPKHPTIMAHPTIDHQKIRFLRPHNGVMLIGYGDWNDNLGPVDVIGYDLISGQPVTLHRNVMTEAFDRIRVFDGHAYLPWVDPKTYAGNQGGMTTDRSGSWVDVMIGPGDSMIHTFDLAKIDGHILACGSRSAGVDVPGTGYGTVWREGSNGAWTQVLRGNNEHSFSRFYSFKMVDGKVRVQNTAGGVETFESVEGVTWYPVVDTAWTSTSTWGADSSDPPPALPARYTNHGAGTVRSAVYHEGWVWVGGESGIVKRALVPDAVETPAPGATPSVNLILNPRAHPSQGNVSPYAPAQSPTTITRVTVGDHPEGVATAARVEVSTGGYGVRFVGVQAAGHRTFTAWVRRVSGTSPWSAAFSGILAGPTLNLPLGVWVEVAQSALSHTVVINDVGFRTSSPLGTGPDVIEVTAVTLSAVSASQMPTYFDGDSSPDLAYRYEWAGTPHNSASFRKVRGAVPDDFASLFTETF